MPIGATPPAVNKVLGSIEVDVRNDADLNAALYETGALYIAIAIPANIYIDPVPEVWDYNANDNALVGYHCVVPGEYDGTTSRDIISWGQRYTMTEAFWQHQVDQAYAVIDQGWIASTGLTPGGLTLSELDAALGIAA